jgi:hypothetical protein
MPLVRGKDGNHSAPRIGFVIKSGRHKASLVVPSGLVVAMVVRVSLIGVRLRIGRMQKLVVSSWERFG